MTEPRSTGLRWGILATGGIAHAFTRDLLTAGLDVTAVGSRRADAAAACSRPTSASPASALLRAAATRPARVASPSRRSAAARDRPARRCC